jgi:hypothetical protein
MANRSHAGHAAQGRQPHRINAPGKRIFLVLLGMLFASFFAGAANVGAAELAAKSPLLGQWLDAKGKRATPIRLSRIKAATNDAGHCNDVGKQSGFNNLRIDGQKIATGKTQETQGVKYQVISALNGSVSSIVLLGNDANVSNVVNFAAINQTLARLLRNAIAQSFECQSNVARLKGSDFDFTLSVKIVAVTREWISLRQNSSDDCGGAHPNSNSSLSTFDLKSGEKMALSRWLTGGKQDRTTYTPPAQLNNIIIQQAIAELKSAQPNENQECIDLLASYKDEYGLSLSKTGMVFSTGFPHVAQACDAEIDIPDVKLQAFLTKEGKDALRQARH